MSSADTAADLAAPTLSPPGWAGVGSCVLNAADTLVPQMLTHHVLMLTISGHGVVEVDFSPYECRPGTLLRLRPGQALRLADPGIVASFVTYDARVAIDARLEAVPGTDDHWRLDGPDAEAMSGGFAQLAADLERLEPGPVAQSLLRHELSTLLLRLALLGGDEPENSESQTYSRFLRRLEDGHPSSRRVEDYAADLGCSVRTLTRASLAVSGRTAKQVVDDRVALQARRLLACTTLSVAEVGRMLGFPEPTNFGRFFHREVGLSPGQFRMDAASPQAIPEQRRPSDGE